MKFISLVGPPNAGKTTLFNYLSGKNIKTVNYPGATVDYNSATFRKQFNLEAHLVDTPGIVSLIPASIDEVVNYYKATLPEEGWKPISISIF